MPLDNTSVIAKDAARLIEAGASNEPLVVASNSTSWISKPVYFQDGIAGALPDIWVREGLLQRLQAVSQSLPKGYNLVLLDGWRPKQVQQSLLNDMRAQIELAHPELNNGEIDAMTELYCSKVSEDPTQPSPHLTGGAVDVTLADDAGVELDMGSAFDEPSQRSWTAYEVSGASAKNRNILHSTMTQAGFTNLPSEWWHYDYGNWLWAWYSLKSAALYGPTAPSDFLS